MTWLVKLWIISGLVDLELILKSVLKRDRRRIDIVPLTVGVILRAVTSTTLVVRNAESISLLHSSGKRQTRGRAMIQINTWSILRQD
jgi:hypothetical protein